jgi:hypothetical protein
MTIITTNVITPAIIINLLEEPGLEYLYDPPLGLWLPSADLLNGFLIKLTYSLTIII